MKIRTFKELLHILAKTNHITVSMRLWEHHGPVARYSVPFEEIDKYTSDDMLHQWGKHDTFTVTDEFGQTYSHKNDRIRILLFDSFHIFSDHMNIKAKNFKDLLTQLSATHDVIVSCRMQIRNDSPKYRNTPTRKPDTFSHINATLAHIERQFDNDMHFKTYTDRRLIVQRTNGRKVIMDKHRIRAFRIKSISIQPIA